MKIGSALVACLCLAGLGELTGCDSTGVGNPNRPGSIALNVVSDDGAPPVEDASVPESLPESGLVKAMIVLGQIRFLPCDPSDAVVSVDGPFVVDLIQGTTEPPIPGVTAPEQGFCRLEAALGPAADPPELRGKSLVFDGMRSDGVRFLLFSEVQATLRVRARAGEAWGAGEQANLLWALRPRRWASDQELLTAMPSAWGVNRRIVLIDVDQHPLLFLAIRARLAGLSTLYADENGNGVLDARERDTEAVGDGLSDAD